MKAYFVRALRCMARAIKEGDSGELDRAAKRAARIDKGARGSVGSREAIAGAELAMGGA